MSAATSNTNVEVPYIYTIDVKNVGQLGTFNVCLTDAVPWGAAFVSVRASKGSCSSVTTVTWNLGHIAADANVTVQLTVTPNVAGGLTNSARLIANDPEPNTRNNSGGVFMFVAGASAELRLTFGARVCVGGRKPGKLQRRSIRQLPLGFAEQRRERHGYEHGLAAEHGDVHQLGVRVRGQHRDKQS